MPQAVRLGGAGALRLLLASHVVAAFEPISVGIAIGAASALTGYLSYKDLYCRFAECCREEQPLNASGRADPSRRGAPGARVGHPAPPLRWGGRGDSWASLRTLSPGGRAF